MVRGVRARRRPASHRVLALASTALVVASLAILTPGAPGGASDTVTVSIGDVTVVEGNTHTRTVSVPVTLSNPLTTKLNVNYKTFAASASAGSDFVAKTAKLAINAGKTHGAINVTVKGDVVPEPDETFIVRLTGTNNPAVTIHRSDGTIKIIDDEAPPFGTPGTPTVSIGDVSVVEGNAGSRTISAPITLSETLTEKLTVRFATANGTAKSPQDYKAKTAKVSVPAGKRHAVVSVVVLGDTTEEPDESFTVQLLDTNNPAVTIARDTATIVLFDDDQPPPAAPDTPQAPDAALVGTAAGELGQVDVSWMPPGDDGGSPITTYQLEVSTNDAVWQPVASTGSVLTYRHDCGLPAVSCRYRVIAVNDIGQSAPSEPSEPIVTQPAPDQPAPPVVTAAGDDLPGFVDVTWTAPASAAQLPVTGYQLDVERDSGPFEPATSTDAATTSHRHFCGLPDITCRYQVVALNDAGASPPSSPSQPITTASAPSPVDAPAAVLAGSQPDDLGAVQVTWTPSTNPGVTSYTVEVSTDLGATWQPTSYIGVEPSHRHDCGLPAVTCAYRVIAHALSGASEPSDASDPVTTQDLPDTPGVPQVTLESQPEYPTPIAGRVQLSWTAPLSDGGAPVTTYQIDVSIDDGSTWLPAVSVNGSETNATHDCGLPTVTCTYRVTAVNGVGASTPSGPSEPVTTQGTPAAPDAPAAALAEADPDNVGFVDLAWAHPGSDGGSTISSFALEVSTDGGSSWTPLLFVPGDVTTYGHFCGVPAVGCSYRVSAGNAVGFSAPSPASETVVTQDVPAAPDAPIATPLGAEPDPDGLIEIAWSPPIGNGGAPVSGYGVQVSRDGGGTWHDATTTNADTTTVDVTCGPTIVTCTYQVIAVNAVGPSMPSAPSNPVEGRTGPLNIIVIMTDDHSPDSVPYYMPYTDTLGQREDGVWKFDQAVATSPVCGPSRASFMTALNVDRHGMNCNSGDNVAQCALYDAAVGHTYPVWLKAAGYSTSYSGKYFNRYPCQNENGAAGWPNPAGWDDWHAVVGSKMAFNNKFDLVQNGTVVTYNDKQNGTPVGPQAYGTYLFGDLAQQHIETCTEPCLTVYMPTAPHEPAGLPADYDSTNYPLPGMLEQHPSWNEGCPGRDPIDDKPYLSQVNIHCGPGSRRSDNQKSLQAVDREIAQLVQAAKDRGVWDRTALIFTSDHGFSFNNNNLWAKQAPYEMIVRVPLVVRVPGTIGGVAPNIVTLNDVTATISDLARATPSRPIDGRSFAPLLVGGSPQRDAAYISLTRIGGESQSTIRPWYSIRQDCALHTPCYKIVKYPAGDYLGTPFDAEWELYDLTADPWELQNLMPNTVTGYPGVEGWDTPEVLALRARLEQAIIDGDID
jgi:arylsulfatase A-like enzyme